MLLPCGGYLVIDETEALIAIDVNTGRNKGTKDLDKTILDTNLEAAYESPDSSACATSAAWWWWTSSTCAIGRTSRPCTKP